MVLDNYRSKIDWWLAPLARTFAKVRPDVFTWWSLFFAVLGGVAFWLSGPGTGQGFAGDQALLWVAWACVLLNSVLDLLDGKIAKTTGQDSPRGDYLDHVIDRFSDVALLAGIAFSGWVQLEWGVAALVGTLLTSYMGTQAQAVGLKRNYGGFLGRADRMVLLMVVPLVEAMHIALPGWAYPPANVHDAAGWLPGSWLGLLIVYFAVVGAMTTVQRFTTGLRGFGPDGEVKD